MCVGDRLPNDRLDNLAGYGLDGHSITVRDIYDAWRSEQSVGTR
jgi:hypothetical protein